MSLKASEISELIKERIKRYESAAEARNIGTVTMLTDGIVRIHGLADVGYGEMLEFPGDTFGVALNLEQDSVGAVVLGDYEHLSEGDIVKTTGRILEVPVGEALLGRVVDSLGRPVDGKGPIATSMTAPIEKVAPGVITRKSVNQPVQTGLKSIDAMVPVGRGQRELIIGDRQTGKTAVAIDAIINQKGTGVKCIYVAIGQKNSSIANVVRKLEEHDAMAHTIVVAAAAAESAAMQYIAPYSGCSMGEYFRDKGEDALIVYDDLTKQAWAYRQVSLLLRRPPGTRGLSRRRVLPALAPARARRAHQRGARGEAHQRRGQGQDRLADGVADHRDAGRRRVRVRADECDLHYGRPDLPGDGPVQLRHPPGHQRRLVGVARRRRRADEDHQEAGRRRAPRARAVPRAGGVLAVRLRSRRGDAQAARARPARHRDHEAEAVLAADGGGDGGVAVRRQRRLRRPGAGEEGGGFRGRAARLRARAPQAAAGKDRQHGRLRQGHRSRPCARRCRNSPPPAPTESHAWPPPKKSAPRSRVSRTLRRSPRPWRWWPRARSAKRRIAWRRRGPTRRRSAR